MSEDDVIEYAKKANNSLAKAAQEYWSQQTGSEVVPWEQLTDEGKNIVIGNVIKILKIWVGSK